MTQLRVFVCYAVSDKPLADALMESLRQAGADVGSDTHALDAGPARDDLARQMRRWFVFLVIGSHAAVASDWVAWQCQRAVERYAYDPSNLLLSVGDVPDHADASWRQRFTRIDGVGALTEAEVIARTLYLLALTPDQSPEATALQPLETVPELLAHGKALVDQHRWAEAAACCQQVAEREPQNLDAWFLLSRVYGGQALHAASLAAAERALAIDDTLALAWMLDGLALGNLGRHGEALTAYDRAISCDPTLADVWSCKGRALVELGRYSEAIACHERALDLNPQEDGAWNSRGVALAALDRYEEATAAFDQALLLEPTHPPLLGKQGACLVGMAPTPGGARRL